MQQPLLYRPVRQLAFLQYRFDLFHWPAFTKGQNPHSVSICRAAQSMRANRVTDTYDVQIGLRLPVEGEIKVAGENLPLRPIVKLDDVALGVRSDFHRPGALILASRDLRRVSPAPRQFGRKRSSRICTRSVSSEPARPPRGPDS